MPPLEFVLLYVHIPKAAGTTMASLLYEQCRNRQEIQEGKFCSGVYYHPAGFIRELDAESGEQVRETLRRDDLRAVIGHFQYGLHQEVPRPCRYATVLREPVSRIRSLYHFQRLNESRYGHLNQVRLPEGAGIEQFVTSPPYPEIDNGMTRRISGKSPAIGQCDRSLLDLAISNLRRFAVVGLSDRFDETVVLMSHEFGWPEPPLYYSININTKLRAEQPTDATIEGVIRDRNALDIELYRVATEIFTQQCSALGSAFPGMVEEYRERKQAWYAARGLSESQATAASAAP